MIRLGGIYALEQIATNSAHNHWPVMEVLTAFVREQAPAKRQPENTPRDEKEQQHLSELRKLLMERGVYAFTRL